MTSICAIRDVVAEAYSVTPALLLSGSTAPAVVAARHVGIHLARKHTDASLEAIGRRFGRSSHGSALYALDRCQKKLKLDPTFLHRVLMIEGRLKGETAAGEPTFEEPGRFVPGSQRRPLREAVKELLSAHDAVVVADDDAERDAACIALEEALKGLREAFEGASS